MLTNSGMNDRMTLAHHVCNFVFLSTYVIFLLVTEHLYNIGRYNNLPFLFFLMANEMVKSYIGYRSGIPLNELFWQDERLVLPPSQKTFKIKDLFRCIFLIIVMIGVYFICAIFFGAEIFSDHEETLMLSITLCAHTVIPSCLHLGPKSTLKIICGCKPSESMGLLIYRNFQAILLGAWLGTFFIPLDWDRRWQKWPIPCLFISVLGLIIYSLVSICLVVSTKRKSMRKPLM